MKLNVSSANIVEKNVTETNVSLLYDQLLATQLKHKQTSTFPIHKVLNFDDKDITDIYQWIEKHVGFPAEGNILDAGCGIGWGTSYIATKTDAPVSGISVSKDEIAQATLFYSEKVVPNLSFHCKSFDMVEQNQYAMIIAVESVKHSTNIRQTIRHLLSALQPGGSLVVVEDTYANLPSDPSLVSFMADWQLSEVLNQAHMAVTHDDMATTSIEYTQYDFTDSMQTPSLLQSKIKRKLMSLLLFFQPKHMGWQAFRGGFTLDMLYANKKMKYIAHVYRKVR